MKLVYQRDDRGLLQPRLVRTPRGLPAADAPVRDVVGSVPPVLTATDRLSDAAEVLQREGGGALPVRAGGDVGILSERDISRAVAEGFDPRVARVGTFMTHDVTTVPPDTRLIDVARTMVEHRIRHIVVTHRETPIAVVSVLDVLAALLPAASPRVGT